MPIRGRPKKSEDDKIVKDKKEYMKNYMMNNNPIETCKHCGQKVHYYYLPQHKKTKKCRYIQALNEIEKLKNSE